jgi:aspartate carbamoyltransferase catalytic subunit
MGAEVQLVGPPTLIPKQAESWGAKLVYDLDSVIEDVDVCYLLRVQRERLSEQLFPSLREYSALWGLDKKRMDRMKPDALVMHPGPMNRGVEIDGALADDSERSLITLQVAMGVAVRMACLEMLLA